MKFLGIMSVIFEVINQQLICIPLILEKNWECGGTVHQVFIDLKEA